MFSVFGKIVRINTDKIVNIFKRENHLTVSCLTRHYFSTHFGIFTGKMQKKRALDQRLQYEIVFSSFYFNTFFNACIENRRHLQCTRQNSKDKGMNA